MSTEIELPILHRGQLAIHRHKARFKSILCGRRWGKTEYLKTIACDLAIKGKKVGYFVPEHKFLSEFYQGAIEILHPIKSSSSKTDGIIKTSTGGQIEFWSLENELAGRSRKYHAVLLDEIAFAKNRTMLSQWERAIRPTLLDYGGIAIAASTPVGIDDENFFYQINTEENLGFMCYHAPTRTNPHLPAEEVAKLEKDNPPMVYKQEYLAEFVDWSNATFFNLSWLLIDNLPVQNKLGPMYVYAVVDSAVKTGTDNDGTGVTYFARYMFHHHPLIILDYDILQIEGALLDTWLPTVFENLEHLAKELKAVRGSAGVWIEDKSSGMVLLQQAKRRNWPAHPIDTKLTALGKDERAISVSGYVYRGEVKLSENAYNKTVTYKLKTRNHLVHQICTFHLGDKDEAKRADDLLDCFTYGISIGLGNSTGY